jgi:hypothetical protein
VKTAVAGSNPGTPNSRTVPKQNGGLVENHPPDSKSPRKPEYKTPMQDSGSKLPNLRTKPAVSGLSDDKMTPISPTKLQAQSSDASTLLVDFFGKNDFVSNFDADTVAILSARSDDNAKIRTLRSQLYQVTADGKKQQVPSHQERVLFEGNMYICLHTFESLAKKRFVEVYLWAGDAVPESVIEDVSVFAKREARSAGGKLVAIRQGKETFEFIEALGGIMITRRGSSNKYDSLAPHILCGRRFAGQIVFDEVDFTSSSLCSGFPYLISTQSGKSYLWKGKGSGVDELSCARLLGPEFGLIGDIEEVEDGKEPPSFLQIFGPSAKIMKSADHWRLKPSYQKYCGRLFHVNSPSKSQVCYSPCPNQTQWLTVYLSDHRDRSLLPD